MRVLVEMMEYTLYTEASGEWTMHAFDASRPMGEQYLYTVRNVSRTDPFASEVSYNAWR